MGADQFCQMLGRQVDFGRIQVDRAGKHPVLLIGAVDVLSGRFRTFSSRRDRITARTVLASAAIPNLFRAVKLEDGMYWDGLFSQNPPVRELLDTGPDELWVIQINPRQRDTEPTTLAEIADRRNELSGNLSLYQELAFIEKIDQLLETGLLNAGGKYKQVVVRVIELSRSSLPRASAASKLNRDPRFIQSLISHGEQQAGEFLAALAFEAAWAGNDVAAVMGHFADDPGRGHPRVEGQEDTARHAVMSLDSGRYLLVSLYGYNGIRHRTPDATSGQLPGATGGAHAHRRGHRDRC